MGVPNDIAEIVIPLETNVHKDGSVFGGEIGCYLATVFIHWNKKIKRISNEYSSLDSFSALLLIIFNFTNW